VGDTVKLEELLDEIGNHLDAHPEHQKQIDEFVAGYFLAPIPPLPKGAQIFLKAQGWYEELREYGKGRIVMSADDGPRRLLGYAIMDNPNSEPGTVFMIRLPKFKEAPEAFREMFNTPSKRAKFASLLEKGTAPAFPTT